MMSGVELPCDWTVNRRPVAAAAIASAKANKDITTTTIIHREEEEEEEEEEEHSVVVAAVATAAAEEEEQQRRKKPKAGGNKRKLAAAVVETSRNNNNNNNHHETHHHHTNNNNNKKKADVETEEESERSVAAHPLGPYMFDETVTTSAAAMMMEKEHPPHDDSTADEIVVLASGRIKALVLKQLRTIDTLSSSEIKKKSLDSESLLSRLPYRKMLSDMFGGSLRGNLRNLSIPYVTRAYEESFMREPMRSNEAVRMHVHRSGAAVCRRRVFAARRTGAPYATSVRAVLPGHHTAALLRRDV